METQEKIYISADRSFLETSEVFVHELETGILPFWLRYSQDEIQGGFYGRVTNDGVPVPQAAKSLILNTRILWSFSAAYAELKKVEYLQLAERAFAYITTHFLDQEFGGAYWLLDCRGNPVDDKKKVYGHAFLIYALAEYYGATGLQQALDLATETFEIIERYSYDSEHGGYFEATQRDFTLTDDLRLSAVDLNEKKSMNAHLHVLEAYTNLLRYWQDPRLELQLTRLMGDFHGRIINPATGHFQLFFNESWEVRSRRISLGHDIEGSWLLCEAAEILGDQVLLDQTRSLAIKQAAAVLAKGLNDDGSLVYEIRSNGQQDLEKNWWAQAEAMVGFLNAYALTGKAAYFEAMLRVWDYTRTFLVDHQHGEWFYKRLVDGSIAQNQYKISEWKGPYHNLRACLEISRRLKRLSQKEKS